MEILFRTDASPAIGAGHVMRCLALAEALIDAGHRCRFVVAEITPALERRIGQAGIGIERIDPAAGAEATLRLVAGCDAVVVDGYRFGEAWRRLLRQGASRVLAFSDDAAHPPAGADLVLDAAADPSAARGLPPGTIGLYGPEYVLLRRELAEAASLPMPGIAGRRSVLVTFGGSDPAGLTLPVSQALAARLPDAEIDVVIGGSVVDGARIAAAVASLGGQVRPHLDPLAMGALMRGAGLAVSAGGGTTFELAALGVPAILVIVADNQEGGVRAMERAGWCEAIDARTGDVADRIAERAAALWRDPARRATCSERARATIDGRGAERVAAALIAAVEA
jgi:UDP-2,4-diacetamido-2,4,6-trideoxy-beta-L-altropyranose hydrolase